MKSLSTIVSLPDVTTATLTTSNSPITSTVTILNPNQSNYAIGTSINMKSSLITESIEVNGTVKLNGEDLEDRLKRIETLLHIPTRDVKMESQHPKLKKLFEEYEKELAKYRTWYKIKDSK